MTFIDPVVAAAHVELPTRAFDETDLDFNPVLLDKRGCVVCSSKPTCPSCSDGESCTFTVQSCSSCPSAICVSLDSTSSASATASASSGSHVNTGAIAGGVVGGLVVFFAIIAFLVWKFVYSSKAKMERLEQQLAYEEDLIKNSAASSPDEKSPRATVSNAPVNSSNFLRYSKYNNQNRMSSTTMSSVTTRGGGGNVIPIAYIPGVFSRAADTQPNEGDAGVSEQYFSADDILRNSQYSNDGAGIRSSIATTSYRGSVAFASDPVVVTQGRPNLVHLTPGNSNPKNSKQLVIDPRGGGSMYSQPSPAEPAFIGSVQQVDTGTQRMNARSIRIGKTAGVGLQSDFITEESDEEAEAASTPVLPAGGGNSQAALAKKTAKSSTLNTLSRVLTLGRTPAPVSPSKSTKTDLSFVSAKSKMSTDSMEQSASARSVRSPSTISRKSGGSPPQRTPSKAASERSPSSAGISSPTESVSSSLLELRASTFSDFDVQWDPEQAPPVPPVPPVPPKSAPSRNPSISSRSSKRPSRAPSARSVKSTTSKNRESLDYMTQLPMEALLYARSQNSLVQATNQTSSIPHRSGSTSPFDDSNSV